MGMNMEISKEKIASMIDHTILKSNATKEEIENLCQEAKKYTFASVCVNPCYVQLVADKLKDTKVKVCTVIGFPLGANTTAVKEYEAKKAVEEGAHEVDMVINVGALKDCDYEYIENDIRTVVQSSYPAVTKVIIETCYLTDEEKEIACRLSKKAGAHFVKTSTGFGTGGATTHDIALMRRTVGDGMQIKASGGIRTSSDALSMIEAGADRLGTSNSVKIISEMLE